MRNYQTLDAGEVDAKTGIITLAGNDSTIAMRREGEYVGISVSYGALEIALRPQIRELIRTVKRLQANDGLQTTWQVGTGNSFLALGLRTDGTLILRPTLINDASGYFCLNFALAPDAAAVLNGWLDAEDAKDKQRAG
jgi:hypothetical protein